jgi:hypothetical protein
MKTKIPEDMKAHLPLTLWGRVLGVTPVVMTVIATLLAGLATSEMTKAQYDRALAAQQQSKAGDQWSFFQAKRLRSAIQNGTLDVVQSGSSERPIDADGLRAFANKLPDPAPVQASLTLLLAGRLPAQAAAPKPDPKVTAALEGIDHDLPEAELTPRLTDATPALVLAAIHLAQDHARAFDALLRPVVTGGDQLGDELDPTGSAPRNLIHDFTVLRLRYSALRYDTEARLNQSIANLYELQVRQSNFSAERHQRRSQRFFFGMLAAQAAVIIATLAMAARQKNLLWAIAAAAGLVAVAFAVYVFLFV